MRGLMQPCGATSTAPRGCFRGASGAARDSELEWAGTDEQCGSGGASRQLGSPDRRASSSCISLDDEPVAVVVAGDPSAVATVHDRHFGM